MANYRLNIQFNNQYVNILILIVAHLQIKFCNL